MRAMESGPARQAIIDRMVDILRADAPWVWGFHPKDYTLKHAWLGNRKPSKVGHNTLKYQRIDVALREAGRDAWNRPVVWPMALVILVTGLLVLPAWSAYRRRETAAAR
jgi:hypothetical protein